jgi:hypothetical protein
MSIVLQSTGGGLVSIVEPTTASNFTQTLPASTGTVMVSGNMPAFSAYMTNGSANQLTTSSVVTKVIIDTEEFDTNSAFDATTNFRFQPLVAGYYQVNGQFKAAGSAITFANIYIYKNGSLWHEGTAFGFTQTAQSNCVVSSLMYLNGSTDYIELWGVVNAGAGCGFAFGQSPTYFGAVLVRAA